MSNFNDYNYNNYDNYNNGNGNRNRGRRGGSAVVVISVALVMLMLGGLIGAVVAQGLNKTQSQAVLGGEAVTATATPEATAAATPEATPESTPEATAAPTSTSTTALAAFSNEIADVVAEAQDSVVGIHNYQMVSAQQGGYYGGFGGYYFGFGGQNGNGQQAEQTEQLAGSGSGVIYSADGYVITNYHVIDGASRVTVVLSTGEEVEATVIGGDSVQDIALLKVDRTGLPAAKMGDSSQVRTGEFAIAIGSPLGDELTGTTTYGIVSYANRTLEIDGAYVSMIQTDAAINAGNSGGALLNVNGEVIGINSRKTSGSTSSGSSIEGIGFAIPINEVKSIVEELITTGKISRPGLGITGQEISESMAAYYNMVPGIYVNTVTEGSAADKAGVKQQDIITALDGKSVTTQSELRAALYSHKIGDTVTLTVYRSGQSMDLSITLEELKS